MKKLISTLAIALPALSVLAVIPQEEKSVGKDINPDLSKKAIRVLKHKAASDENQNSFFEGFEGRNPDAYGSAANAWLPFGWTQFSREGNKHLITSTAGFWDLTWLTLSNETVGSLPSGDQTSSYEGNAFAYIMADVMWGEKKPYPDLGLDYATNHPQDEWLVSPAITPNPQEWFYFQIQFRPGWSLYNREANDFSGETTLMEVYVTEGDGSNDSEWTKLWSLKDYILANYTEEELRQDLSSLNNPDYAPIYVNVSQYVGKKIKMAFRYFGVNGQGMALDNVALGIPMPKPSYTTPAGFFTQQSLTPTMQFISGTPQMLIPFGETAVWTNTSKDILTSEWKYDNIDGTKLTTKDYHLTSPEYSLGHKYEAPILTGSFESRSATFQTQYTAMQAGGHLTGTGTDGYDGEMGIAAWNYLDPNGTLGQMSSILAFSNELDDQWELIFGRMPNTLDILGFGCVYPQSSMPYGFDYVDIFAQIKGGEADGSLNDETALVMNVFRLPANEFEESATVIGQGILTGKDINALPDLEAPYMYKNLRFKMNVPVVADGNILVLIAPYNIEGNDIIVFPYMKSTNEKVWGNSVVYMYVYENEENGESYDTFYNLNAYPFPDGHFAGFTMSLGASYSYMEAPSYNGEEILIPEEGGDFETVIRSMYGPEKWGLTTDFATVADWISVSATQETEGSDLYDATLKFETNLEREERKATVYLTQAGSRVAFNVVQSGRTAIGEIAATTSMSVKTVNRKIIVDGAKGDVMLYNATGAKVASTKANGTVIFDVPGSGIFVIRSGQASVKVIL